MGLRANILLHRLVVNDSLGDLQVTEGVQSAIYRLTVTSTSATLAALAGEALSDDVCAIALVPETGSGSVRMAMGGAASAASPELASGGEAFGIRKADGDAMQLYAASTTYVKLVVLVPRG